MGAAELIYGAQIECGRNLQVNDRAVGLLEQYDIEVHRTRKGRGAILCDTSRGCLIFKEYMGNEQKIALQDSVLRQIGDNGGVKVDQIVPNKEGSLLVKENDGISYVLKTWFEGRECNIYDRGECVEAVRLLAALHNSMEKIVCEEGLPVSSPEREYEKHNRELKRVRKFLSKKGQKTWFEICLLDAFDDFLMQALEITEQWQAYSHLAQGQPECGCLCHGDYQYHNIIKSEGEWYIINFEKCIRDNPIRDLYLLLRKLLEKSNWSVSLGKELLTAYEEVRPISAYSRIDLYYRLAYPEKFWKIANFYYNSGKAWIPERNLEKLNKLLEQEAAKQEFLDSVFREVK